MSQALRNTYWLLIRNLALSITLSAFTTRGTARADGATVPNKHSSELIYVGSQDRAIYALRFDSSTGDLSQLGAMAADLRATYLLAHPQKPILYAVNDEKTEIGSVTAFRVDPSTAALSKLNQVTSGGAGTTHLFLDASSSTMLAANFGGGSTSSISIRPDGTLGELVSTIHATGTGPHRRQAAAHNHGAVLDPTGRYALVTDLGADRVFVYAFDGKTHSLLPDGAAHPRSFAAPPGSGPRHVVLGAAGRFAYVINELTAEVMVLRWNSKLGTLTHVQTLSIGAPGFTGEKSGAEIATSADKRFLYAADRGGNALVVLRIDKNSGRLTTVERVPSGGTKPWGFALHSSGKWLLVANQASGNISTFRVDVSTGKLRNVEHSVALPAPVAVAFVN